jgi:hypothetical protein
VRCCDLERVLLAQSKELSAAKAFCHFRLDAIEWVNANIISTESLRFTGRHPGAGQDPVDQRRAVLFGELDTPKPPIK